MIDPNWVTAFSTAVVGVTGPIAVATWLSQRRQALRQEQADRERARDKELLRKGREEFIPKSWTGPVAVVGLLAALIAAGEWSERRKSQ